MQLLALPVRILDAFRGLDFLAPLAIRLYLFPVFLMAGMQKVDITTGKVDPQFVAWLGNTDWGLGLPAPELLGYLAGYTELLGAFALLAGFATRFFAIPLMVTMVVAAVTAHWANGWPAIAPSNPASICIEGSDAARQASSLERIAQCHNVNDRTIEAAERLSKAKDILKEHGNYSWLTGRGSLVILNNGIEFAVTYFILLLVLFFMGAGRFFSLDYWVRRLAMPD